MLSHKYQYISKVPDHCYKILCFNKHSIFINQKKYVPALTELTLDNKFELCGNILQVRSILYEHHKFKSCVIYKFDSGKIKDIEYNDKTETFLTNYLEPNSVIRYKYLFFDPNKINEYYADLDKLLYL